jgi:hypothetical protein
VVDRARWVGTWVERRSGIQPVVNIGLEHTSLGIAVLRRSGMCA